MNRLSFWFILVVIAFPVAGFAGEYTNSITKIGEAEYADEKMTTVQVFNEAMKYAIQDAENQGEASITGGSSMSNLNIDAIWVKKQANLQVVDVQVLEKEFVKNNRKHVKVRVRVTFDFLNVPKFMNEYDKSVTGAALRTMAFPGWGQMYNKTHITGILYGALFTFFYYSFIIEADRVAKFPGNRPGHTLADREIYEDAEQNMVAKYQLPALIIWAFALSEASASRALGQIGLVNLRKAYRLGDYTYVRPTNEQGIVVDFYLFHLRF